MFIIDRADHVDSVKSYTVANYGSNNYTGSVKQINSGIIVNEKKKTLVRFIIIQSYVVYVCCYILYT